MSAVHRGVESCTEPNPFAERQTDDINPYVQIKRNERSTGDSQHLTHHVFKDKGERFSRVDDVVEQDNVGVFQAF